MGRRPAPVAHGDGTLDGPDQILDVKGLFQVNFCVDCARLGTPIRGHHDHRDRNETLVLFLSESELPAIHGRHHQIEHDHVRIRALTELVQRVLAILGLQHLEPRFIEGVGYRRAQFTVVLDHE